MFQTIHVRCSCNRIRTPIKKIAQHVLMTYKLIKRLIYALFHAFEHRQYFLKADSGIYRLGMSSQLSFPLILTSAKLCRVANTSYPWRPLLILYRWSFECPRASHLLPIIDYIIVLKFVFGALLKVDSVAYFNAECMIC